MLTGCYPPRIGFGSFDGAGVLFPGQGIGLNPRETTIAGMLKTAGYHTKIVGKWHCGDQKEFLPLNHGFDEYYGLPFSNDMGRQAPRANYPPLPLMRNNEVVQEQPDLRNLTERYVEESVSFIRKHKQESFFLYFAHMHVHRPLYAAEPFVSRSLNGDYGACVECVDWSVSCVMHELRNCGIEENTLVIFTSDNGSRGDLGGSNAPLRGRKMSTWEGGLRVPCVFYQSGRVRPGVCEELISSIDFLPTIARLCGIEAKPSGPIDGVDISCLLFDGKTKSPRKTFYYYMQNELEAVRHGDWKLHVRKDNKNVTLLYNLREDIGEQRDRYDDYPEIAAELRAPLARAREELGDSAGGITGRGVRPAGRVDNPQFLTEYDPDHPYIIALYDREENG
jgi:arylsulfatase A-like enzyme